MSADDGGIAIVEAKWVHDRCREIVARAGTTEYRCTRETLDRFTIEPPPPAAVADAIQRKCLTYCRPLEAWTVSPQRG